MRSTCDEHVLGWRFQHASEFSCRSVRIPQLAVKTPLDQQGQRCVPFLPAQLTMTLNPSWRWISAGQVERQATERSADALTDVTWRALTERGARRGPAPPRPPFVPLKARISTLRKGTARRHPSVPKGMSVATFEGPLVVRVTVRCCRPGRRGDCGHKG